MIIKFVTYQCSSLAHCSLSRLQSTCDSRSSTSFSPSHYFYVAHIICCHISFSSQDFKVFFRYWKSSWHASRRDRSTRPGESSQNFSHRRCSTLTIESSFSSLMKSQQYQLHRAIAIPEILSLIFSHASSSNLASYARVCKFWMDPALDRLWERVNDPTIALRLLAPLKLDEDSFSQVRNISSARYVLFLTHSALRILTEIHPKDNHTKLVSFPVLRKTGQIFALRRWRWRWWKQTSSHLSPGTLSGSFGNKYIPEPPALVFGAC